MEYLKTVYCNGETNSSKSTSQFASLFFFDETIQKVPRNFFFDTETAECQTILSFSI
jgi:hypothetical protein